MTFEFSDMLMFIMFQELGLYSLTDILRGAVYLNKNPILCFVDTIEWDKIARSSPGGHFITVS